MYLPFAKQNQAEVWPRFHFRTIGVEWVKVPNAWDPLCLWQCFEYPLDIKGSQHWPWPTWDCPERILFFSVCGNKPYNKSVRKPNSYIILYLTSSTAECGSKISLKKNNPCNLLALRGKDKTGWAPYLATTFKTSNHLCPLKYAFGDLHYICLWLHYSGLKIH